jgi:hypothetical protein
MVPLNQLKRANRNSRTHPPQQIDQIVKSIQHFGYVDPVLADENLIVIGGHARAEAAARAGLREIPVIVISGLSDPEKRALAIADNKIATNAGWDRNLLAEEIGELAKQLPEINLDLQITGFEELEIETLLGDIADCGTVPGDKVVEHETKHPGSKGVKTVSRAGDLWELGQDKILCGGSLSAEHIRRVAEKHGAILIVPVEANDLAAKRVRRSPQAEWDSPAQYFYQAAGNEFAESVCNVLSNALRGAVNNTILFVIMQSPQNRKALGTGAVFTPSVADIAIRHWQARTDRHAILAITRDSFDYVAFMRRKSGSGS